MKALLKGLKKLTNEYGSIFLIPAYAAFYIPCFVSLERQPYSGFHIIHMAADDCIPFCELFVIPYYIWFIYMIASVAACIFTDRKDYIRSFFYMSAGMTIFVAVSWLYPNCHELRPAVITRKNVFTSLVSFIYSTDTPANLFPSIHVYNSIAAHMTVIHNKVLSQKKWIRTASFIMCISILASTLFIKQHSLFDIITAIVLNAVLYPFAYELDYSTAIEKLTRISKRPVHSRLHGREHIS